MANMKKQSVKGATLWVWEGDLVHDHKFGGDIPLTFVCMQLKGAPNDQVWFFKHFYLAEWIEDGYSASCRPEQIISEATQQGSVNLLDDWVTSPEYCINGNVAERQLRFAQSQTKSVSDDDSDIPY